MAEDQKRTEEMRVVDWPIALSNAVVCYAECWPCQFGDHFDPPQAHTWMDDEDAEHAGVTLPIDPTLPGKLCGCSCAKVAVSGGTPEPTDG